MSGLMDRCVNGLMKGCVDGLMGDVRVGRKMDGYSALQNNAMDHMYSIYSEHSTVMYSA